MQNQRYSNWTRVEGNWGLFSHMMRSQWGRLTEQDLNLARGDRRRLARCLQARYGIPAEEAEQQIETFLALH
jgi:uncharacterized protein YjbJ (UPF0337 family)